MSLLVLYVGRSAHGGEEDDRRRLGRGERTGVTIQRAPADEATAHDVELAADGVLARGVTVHVGVARGAEVRGLALHERGRDDGVVLVVLGLVRRRAGAQRGVRHDVLRGRDRRLRDARGRRRGGVGGLGRRSGRGVLLGLVRSGRLAGQVTVAPGVERLGSEEVDHRHDHDEAGDDCTRDDRLALPVLGADEEPAESVDDGRTDQQDEREALEPVLQPRGRMTVHPPRQVDHAEEAGGRESEEAPADDARGIEAADAVRLVEVALQLGRRDLVDGRVGVGGRAVELVDERVEQRGADVRLAVCAEVLIENGGNTNVADGHGGPVSNLREIPLENFV